MSGNEIWKDVVGYGGLYKVSDRGNVRSVERISLQGRKIGGIILKPMYHRNGYLHVNLYKNGEMKGKCIHRLVAEAFLPNPNGSPQINHIDEIKDNNNAENLEWCTSKHNANHGTRTERVTQKLSKRVKGVNVETGEVITFNSTQEAERKGYNSANVSASCRGIYKSPNGNLIGGNGRTYKGYRWYYEEGE